MTDLPERLRNAAAAHRPDRERMLARVEHAMAVDGSGSAEPDAEARGHDRPAPWMRVTAVTAAVAGAIGLGGLAVASVTGNGNSPGTVVTSGGAGSPRPTPSASADSGSADGRVPVPRHSTSKPPHRKGATPRGTPSRSTPTPPVQPPPPSVPGSGSASPAGGDGTSANAPQSSGPLQSNGVVDSGSNSYWTQSNVELVTQQKMTSLTVELRIARGHGETDAGNWTSVSQTQVRVSVEGNFIVYRWTLNAGQSVPAGSYTFAGQFNHDQGQGGTDGDDYTVTAGFDSGTPVTVAGHF